MFVEVSEGYQRSKTGQDDDLSDSQYSPIARAAYRRLYATDRELVLFTSRAMLDKGGCGLEGIKDDLCKMSSSGSVAASDEMEKSIGDFNERNCQKLDSIKSLRNKTMAHTDRVLVFSDFANDAKVSDVVEVAEEVIALLEALCGVYLETFRLSSEKRTRLILLHEVHAKHDATESWKHNFSTWAK